MTTPDSVSCSQGSNGSVEAADKDTEMMDVVEESPSKSIKKKKTEVCSPEWLKQYYSILFPFDLVHAWLSYGDDKHFSKREFSFTLMNSQSEEIYMRYQSFFTKDEFKQAMCQRCPVKMDIGAVYNMYPKDKHSVPKDKFYTQERELVFDVDLTDYDGVRKCGCQGASFCSKCWPLMTMAMKVVNAALRDDFAFQNVAWFYSGRRGVHCWVSDQNARTLPNDARSAIASYLQIMLGTDTSAAEPLPSNLHPALKRAYETLEPLFIENLLPEDGHGLLSTPHAWQGILATLPDTCIDIGKEMNDRWLKEEDTMNEEQRWDELKQALRKKMPKLGSPKKKAKNLTSAEIREIKNWPIATVFQYTYPRLDVNVSKMQNHLLKTPFGIHPKTGRVCVYIPNIDDFDPFAVPTLSQVLKELETQKGETLSWKNTSLKESFSAFEKDILKPLQKEQFRHAKQKREEQAALIGDF